MVNSKIEEYIQEICSYVKFKKAHKEIRTEFLNHIEEKTEDLMKQGMNEEEASRNALAEMGEAEAIGKLLNQSHKSAPEWSILIITILFTLLGLTIAYLLITTGINQNTNAFKKTSVFTIMGYVVMTGLYLFDYKKLEKHSGKIFIGVSALLMVQLFFSVPVNGIKSWFIIGPFNISITELSLFIYVISLSKLLRNIELTNAKSYLYLTSMLLIPIMLFFQLRVTMAAATYFVVFTMFMLKSKIKKAYTAAVIGIFTAGSFYMVISEPYRLKRLMVFLNPSSDPLGAGWLNIQIQNLLSSVGYFGNGFNFPKKTIPVVESDFVLTYIIYTFGWIAGFILIIIIAAFIVRMFTASNMVKDVYGNGIIQGFMLVFAMEFMWNILMILGFAPIVSVNLPFISYGGSSLLSQMAAIGVIMSIYRCRTLSFS